MQTARCGRRSGSLEVNLSRFDSGWRRVALGGVIGFIGLIVPHLLRLALGSENRYLLPISALSGAMLLVFADIIARVALESAELPLVWSPQRSVPLSLSGCW